MGPKKISVKYIKFFAYLLVIILVNLAGITLFFRIDLTESKIYSISSASRRVVSTLSEPLTINVFFTRSLPAPYNNTEQYLTDLLEEYATYANRYFNYRFYDVSPDEGDISRETKENQELANNYGIHPVQIRTFEKDEVKFQKAYMGLVMIHGDVIERIPTITSTDGLEYKLTNAILKLNNKVSALLSLSEKIRIKLFLSSSLEQVAPYMGLKPITEMPSKIERIVKKLNSKHYGQLQFEYLDPSTDKGLKKESEKYNMMSLSWPAIPGKIKEGKGVIGLVMEYKDKSVHIPLLRVFKIPVIGTQYQLTDINQMEEIMNESLESLIEINENIGLLTSHGSLDVQGTFHTGPDQPEQADHVNNFRELISENYTMKAVNLKESNIPEGLDCLVIVRPTETFSDYELLQIDQFLMQGKSLAVFLDAFEEVMPPRPQGMTYKEQNPRYVPLKTGLEKLLAHYGVSIRNSYVMDENSFKQKIPARFGGGERPIYFAPIIKNRNISHDLDFMKNIKGLIALKISPLALEPQRIKENGLAAYRLFSSSEKSWEMSGQQINLNPMFIQPPKSADDMQRLPLAYIITGTFPSYFNGKPIPEKTLAKGDAEESDTKKEPDKKPDIDLSKIKGKGEFISQGKPGKIFLMASSDMLKDNILDTKERNPNTIFIMNLLDYLNNREDIAVLRGKEQRFNPLIDTDPGIKTVIKSFNIAGLPVLVILFGLTVWFRRHLRKKHIQMMFQK